MSKVALVTGGSQGIGKAIVETLSRDGFDVAVVARKKDKIDKVVKEINSNGGKAVGLVADVSKPDDVNNAVLNTVKAFGHLDVYVNNAGIACVMPILKTDTNTMKKVLNVNLMGTMYGIQAAAKQYIKQGTPGKIISACSIAGQVGYPGFGAYSSSKFAIKGLTEVAAKELAKNKITVNAYCPGIVDTPMSHKMDDLITTENHMPKGSLLKNIAKGIALGRIGKPQDIANFVSFLASPKANFVTGQCIIDDGGRVFR